MRKFDRLFSQSYVPGEGTVDMSKDECTMLQSKPSDWDTRGEADPLET